jgi:molybdopterin converting factor small subunit
MKVQISMYATLKRYAPGDGGNFELNLAAGARVKTLTERLKIPRTVERVILINGRPADDATPLTDGDEITIFPPIEGG